MARLTNCAAAFTAAMILAGCAAVSDTLFPPMAGESSRPTSPQRVDIPPGPNEISSIRALGTSTFEPSPVTPDAATSTDVGRAYDLNRPISGGPAASGTGSPAELAVRRPLVVIRFDRQDVDYQQALSTAVNRALERRPQAMFDLVAIAPTRGTAAQAVASTTAARRNAENVMRSLTGMGLPASRLSLSATSSADAQSSEVHLYGR